jgi:hypothetical protein
VVDLRKFYGGHGIFVYTHSYVAGKRRGTPVVSRLIYEVVKWRARRGLTREVESFADAKTEASQRGVRGETFAYWYLRRQGYDGDTLALVEVRTRTAREDQAALPELSVTLQKQQTVARTALRFLSERHVKKCPMRFDVVAIEEVPGESPVVRLHKAAFYPQR